MPFEIIRDDITKVKADAVVNAANPALKMGGGVCGAIFRAAGAEDLQAACDEIGGCRTGEAVITKGFKLPAKYIIHTVGPIYRGGNNNEEDLLRKAYLSSMELAKEYKLESIAFPLISSGIYGYPKDEALRVAVSAIAEFLMDNEMIVYLVMFDTKALAFSEKLFKSIEEYIDDKYVEDQKAIDKYRKIQEFEILYQAPVLMGMDSVKEQKARSLEDVVNQLDETFSEMLLRLIDQKGKTDVETYKKANIDRKLFSKIRTDKNYKPRKNTVLAFAVALELNMDETKDLLMKAGYALSHSHKFDLIVEYFLEKEIYDIYKINEALFAFDQQLLGL